MTSVFNKLCRQSWTTAAVAKAAIEDDDRLSEIDDCPPSDDHVVHVHSGTFQCPLENDGTLLLSTIQSQIPWAAGLWYMPAESNCRRAIRLDSASGRLFPPNNGWGDRIYTEVEQLLTSKSNLKHQNVMLLRKLKEKNEVLMKVLSEGAEAENRQQLVNELQKEIDSFCEEAGLKDSYPVPVDLQ
ncbi:unnamed protein product [Soboliphyme baturini]|uniref:TDP43_N domain-containing protein n=1 Tax=Soboliphyme baturini TaxID=241478 RepID=A0A183IW00_9BILA|nr:unnamed protein product [Soboliphyme baturini]